MVPFFLFLSLSASDNVLPNCVDLSLSQPLISAHSSALGSKDAQDLMYDASDPHPPGSIQLAAPRPSSMLKGMIQNCMKTIPRVSTNSGGRTSSRPNEGLLGSPNPHQSCPPSPALNTSPHSPVVLLGNSPPSSPASAIARRLSPCRSGNTTSPRPVFSSHYNDHLAFAPPNILPPSRHASSSGPFPLPSSLSSNHSDDRRFSPNLPFDHILPSISPTPHSFH